MPQPYPLIPMISTTVAASPALAAETTICTVTVGSVADATSLLDISGWAAFTVGTSGTAVRFRVRRGSLTGTVCADTGALTGGVVAAALLAQDVQGVDTPGEVASLAYVLTMQVTAGAGASTVSAVKLRIAGSG